MVKTKHGHTENQERDWAARNCVRSETPTVSLFLFFFYFFQSLFSCVRSSSTISALTERSPKKKRKVKEVWNLFSCSSRRQVLSSVFPTLTHFRRVKAVPSFFQIRANRRGEKTFSCRKFRKIHSFKPLRGLTEKNQNRKSKMPVILRRSCSPRSRLAYGRRVPLTLSRSLCQLHITYPPVWPMQRCMPVRPCTPSWRYTKLRRTICIIPWCSSTRANQMRE